MEDNVRKLVGEVRFNFFRFFLLPKSLQPCTFMRPARLCLTHTHMHTLMYEGLLVFCTLFSFCKSRTSAYTEQSNGWTHRTVHTCFRSREQYKDTLPTLNTEWKSDYGHIYSKSAPGKFIEDLEKSSGCTDMELRQSYKMYIGNQDLW